MKIKVEKKPLSEALKLVDKTHKKPKKTNMFFRTLLKVASSSELKKTNFKLTKVNMDRLGKDEPCLYLMNHSSFTDLNIVSCILYPRPFNIVCTSDGFVGKERLMRNLGCIPTKKFVTDFTLIKDMSYCFKTLKTSVLMYPEASYSFDGTATPLPDTLGKMLKLMKVPLVMIKTHGAFLRDPLYNGLRKRKVDVSATETYLLSPDEINEKSVDELNEILKKEFSFDYFKEQREEKISVDEPFRAEGLNRILYKCPNCMTEGKTDGKDDYLICHSCNKKYFLDEFGVLSANEGKTEYTNIPDWYNFEREEVKKEIENNTYKLECECEICVLVNMKSIYDIGAGKLTHTKDGFVLKSEENGLEYKQSPLSSYSLYSDYFWYEIGDVICIGNSDVLYYCFPKNSGDIVAKARLATEELYKIKIKEKRVKAEE